MDFKIFDKIFKKESSIAVIGLGYVGLPIALCFAKKTKVIGYDLSLSRIEMMKQKIDPSGEMLSSDFEACEIEFTSNPEELKKANFFIIAVPTPIDSFNLPDLRALMLASDAVGKVLKKGDYVIYESTVYPGCTEDDCIPVLEKVSGLKFNADFKVGYSPERINPGDKEHTLMKITKVVSGGCEVSLAEIARVYGIIIDAGIYQAQSIKVAEAAKIIENTQRDLNIALMNELSFICDKLDISTYEVLEAAGTKWNFLKFYPGLVGGHCIGVDPYYLTYKAKELGYNPNVILSGRFINDSMGAYVAKKTLQLLLKMGKDVLHCKVLVMGATFKENVSDIRNSKVVDIIHELQSYSIKVDIVDPLASAEEFKKEYKMNLETEPESNYDVIILAVSHKKYVELDPEYFNSITSQDAIFIDVKGVFRNKIKGIKYWSF